MFRLPARWDVIEGPRTRPLATGQKGNDSAVSALQPSAIYTLRARELWGLSRTTC